LEVHYIIYCIQAVFFVARTFDPLLSNSKCTYMNELYVDQLWF